MATGQTLSLSQLHGELDGAITQALADELARFAGEDDHSIAVREGVGRAQAIVGPAIARMFAQASRKLSDHVVPDTANRFIDQENTRQTARFMAAWNAPSGTSPAALTSSCRAS